MNPNGICFKKEERRKQMKSRQEMEGNGNVELGNLYSLTLKQELAPEPIG